MENPEYLFITYIKLHRIQLLRRFYAQKQGAVSSGSKWSEFLILVTLQGPTAYPN